MKTHTESKRPDRHSPSKANPERGTQDALDRQRAEGEGMMASSVEPVRAGDEDRLDEITAGKSRRSSGGGATLRRTGPR